MTYLEKELSSELIYEGRVVTLLKQKVELPNGATSTREVIRHRPASVIIPLITESSVLLVRQFRKPIDKELLEFPAGISEDGEDLLDTAIRELEEETGYYTENHTFLGKSYPAPGFCDELLHFYCANDLKKTQRNLDYDEFVSVEEYSIESVRTLILEGKIQDAKTIIGFHYLEKLLCQN